ncbi:extracellular catalytic domain type 1 short-chain-length polyhydroxyalkanoate depolymerase [Polaromonas sp. DSR2-3-2]|uniref:extracellular catalytic domain type 1 short-chain-length polyhydroxyalkanoate depolymerase n=1 Tax=unclassified Polaromonas TaxID=2638319 RepID=UPI003CF2FA97
MNPNLERILAEASRLAQNAIQQGLAAASQHTEGGGAAVLPQLAGAPKNTANPMNNPAFQNSMAEATRLMQSGNLQAATAAIQAALSGAAVPASADDLNVIDVEAHEVGRAAPAQKSSEPAVKPGPAGQFISGSHSEGTAGSRDYKLYIPPASFTEPLPLVVMLHGCTQNPDDFAAGTGMNDAALKRGFYVLYPSQTQHANSSRCWNWFKHNHQKRGRGEPAVLAGMTRDVMARYNIDPKRVYVAGLSAGGAMAAILGDAYPDLFAAVGVHSGLATGSATNVQTALSVMQTGAAPTAARTTASPPTIVFHGDKDATVNPVNGEQVLAASAGAHQPETKRAKSANGRDYTQRVYKAAGGRVVAEHWAVHGAGHAWSGGSARGSYTDGTGPDASEEMLRFFLANTLPAKH